MMLKRIDGREATPQSQVGASGSGTQILAAVLSASMLAAVGILCVHHKVSAVDQGYRLGELDRERQTLERENLALKVQLATLRSSQHIEAQARTQLGMVAPAASAIVAMNGPAALEAPDSPRASSKLAPRVQGRAGAPAVHAAAVVRKGGEASR